MSIILGLVTSRDGIVMSDGRMFGSALLDNGKVVEEASIKSEEFDKTFCLDQGRLIGTLAGLMQFSGKKVSEHIEDIWQTSAKSKTEFTDIANELCEGLKGKLTNINPNDVVFECRKIDLVLIGRMTATKRQLVMGRFRFSPMNNQMSFSADMFPGEKLIKYCTFGDEKAQAAVARVMTENKTSNRYATFLKILANRSIRAGIKRSGCQPYGSEPACGGRTFTQVIHC
jgi:hypothetical protein